MYRIAHNETALPTYRLRVAWREKHGVVRPPLFDEPINAASLREAIGAVLGSGTFLADGANLAWLSDEAGNLLWTLRMDEQSAETT